uniref:Dihydrofolate reductase family protein n=1 Tax=Roseihalotalea indica TaxID=2867963 RepID=A0AA49GNG6_9BACT|nr:dihydrofolate reductase family protein [Tunicatimonas sp. TK19036]
MRKLKLQVQMSVDGYIAGPNGEMDWLVWDWDDALKQYVDDLTNPVDTIVLGRNLAQGFIPTWTSRLESDTNDEDAKKFVKTPKVVFTKTLEKSEWAHTVLATGDLKAEINELKEQDGGDIIAYGGGTFVSSLVKHNLIDEYHLFINPTSLGGGMPIFEKLEQPLPMKLVKSIPFSCGIVVVCYQPG